MVSTAPRRILLVEPKMVARKNYTRSTKFDGRQTLKTIKLAYDRVISAQQKNEWE